MDTLHITHGSILTRYWGSILLTLLLIALSASLWLLQPFVLGRAIDGLIAGRWAWVIGLAGLQVVVLGIGAARRAYDTRTYAKIYRDIVQETVRASRFASVPLNRISARAGLLREVTRFYELQLPLALRAVINLFGSLGFLLLLSGPVFLACLGAAAASLLVSLFFAPKLMRVARSYNDEIEHEIDVISRGDDGVVERHFEEVTRWQVKRSDMEVAMFGLSNVVLSGVLLFALYQMVAVEAAAVGTVFAVFSYVTRFQRSLTNLPRTFQQLIRTTEITRRVNDLETRRNEDSEAPLPHQKLQGAPMRKRAGAVFRTFR